MLERTYFIICRFYAQQRVTHIECTFCIENPRMLASHKLERKYWKSECCRVKKKATAYVQRCLHAPGESCDIEYHLLVFWVSH